MSKNSGQNLEEKQSYLRKQILQSGYDPQDFLSFMCPNSESIDLEEYDIHEIVGIVTKYKYVKQIQKNKISNNIEKPTMMFQKQLLKEIINKKSKVQYERYQPLFDYEVEDTYKCIQHQPLIKIDKLIISVPKIQITQTQGFLFGIGSTKQVYFVVESNACRNGQKKIVKRLDDDFIWLSESLIRLYPYILLPQLLPYKKQDENHEQIRRKQIGEYLQHLSYRQQMLICQILLQFLTLDNEKFVKCKKSYDSMNFIKGVSLIKSINGEVKMEISNNLRQFIKSSISYTNKVVKIHQNLQQNIKKLVENYQIIQQNLHSIVVGYGQLYDCYNELANKFPTKKVSIFLLKSNKYSEMVVNINGLFVSMTENVNKYIEILKEQIKDYYSLESTYNKNIVRLHRYTKQAQKDYLQFKYTLHRKKQRIYNDPQKWQISKDKLQQLQKINLLIKQMNKLNNNLKINSSNSKEQNLINQQLTKIKTQINQYLLPKQTTTEKQLKLWYGFTMKNYENQFLKWINISQERYVKQYKKFVGLLLEDDQIYVCRINKFLKDINSI